MYAIAFDLVVSDLKQYYQGAYNNAYFDIKKILQELNFVWTQGSVYLSTDNDLTKVYLAVNKLSEIDWFTKSLRDLRVFRVEDWSNFTDIVKKTENY